MRSLRWQVWTGPPLLVGNPALLQEVRRPFQSAPRTRSQLGGLAEISFTFNSANREGVMTFQISQRGQQYLKTARTLLGAAQTMTDDVIASQLKALADEYERRAEKASRDDAAKALARAAARAEREAT